MPPPMPNPAKRFTANPAKPVGRYRPGKAVEEEEDSDEEGFETEDEDRPPPKPQPKRPQTTSKKPLPKQAAEIEEDDEEGFVTDEEDEPGGGSDSDLDSKPQQSTARTAEALPITTTGHSDVSSDERESDDESDDEESSSESEPEPIRKFQRPTFIKKVDRNQPATTDSTILVHADSAADPAEEARRKEMAELMIKDELEKAAAARLAGKKYWDDDEDLAPEDMVDDTDGLDPVLERKAWEVRELKRLKRDRERIEAREKEIEEIERRRNLTREEREKEDAEFLAKQKEERDGNRGEAGFMKKYYHKGAFFMDDEDTRRLTERNIMGQTFQDEIDKSTLPEYMRVRDLNKLGKTGGTKYKDLRSEDTGRFGDEVKRWRPGDSNARNADGSFSGVDERFLSDRDRERLGPTSSGANTTTVGIRRPRKSLSRSRSRSQSRSSVRRKRSISPYRDRDDKRRRTRVDA